MSKHNDGNRIETIDAHGHVHGSVISDDAQSTENWFMEAIVGHWMTFFRRIATVDPGSDGSREIHIDSIHQYPELLASDLGNGPIPTGV